MQDFIATLNNFDTSIFLFLNGLHTDFLDPVMMTVSGKLPWIPFYIFLAFMLFRRVGRNRGIIFLLMIGLTILAADQIGSQLIRPAFERLRPSNPDNPISPLVHIVNGYRGGRYGFPSCHAANTFAVATMLTLVFKRRQWTIGMYSWAAVVSYSRIYLGVHYTGDIFVGAVLGSAVAVGFYYLGLYLIANSRGWFSNINRNIRLRG